jgi:hypothetical protein
MSTASVTSTRRALHGEGCLFCREHDGGFEAEEHIFSYALGNRACVLPPGVVCDRCNNGPLAKADEALSSFPPIEMLRAERGIGTRSGKPIIVKRNGTHVWWSAPGELRILPGKNAVVTHTGPSSGRLTLNSGKQVSDRFMRQLAHAIWKMGLEVVYLHHGEVAFDPKFDPVREAVIGKTPTRSWCVGLKEAKPHNMVDLEVELDRVIHGAERAPLRLDVFGIVFYSDLLALDLNSAEINPPWAANVWTFGPGNASRGVKIPHGR